MPDTTIRVKDVTYTKLIQARGAFEQTFGTKLTIDDTVYLESLYTNIIFGLLQKLRIEGFIKTIEDNNGIIRIEIVDPKEIVDRLTPEVIEAFKEFRSRILERKLEIPHVITRSVE